MQSGSGPGRATLDPGEPDPGPGPVPLERLEAEICELAGHLAAATCRFLVLLGDFDARQGWASWEMTSCAAWLSWKGQMSSHTAREHVRALVTLAEAFLAGKVAVAADPEVYQVIVHVGIDAITPESPPAGPVGVSAETPPRPSRAAPSPPPKPAPLRPPGHPADPGRCQVEDGPAISPSAAQMLACGATWTWMLHDSAGKLLDLGRHRRRPNAALRRAARERDKCRCRFPGCESRRVDLHHIKYWSNGGRTTLDNLVSLCKYHHLLVHDRGYLIAAARDGTFTFYRPDGTAIPTSPALPEPAGIIGDCHDADITPETIIPPWYGERLDLDYAIHVCFANARTEQERQTRLQCGEAETRGRVTIYEPEDWDKRIRRYYHEHPRGLYRVVQSIPG